VLPESSRLHEKALEEALMDHLQKFLLELGKGVAFMARQQRITPVTDSPWQFTT